MTRLFSLNALPRGFLSQEHASVYKSAASVRCAALSLVPSKSIGHGPLQSACARRCRGRRRSWVDILLECPSELPLSLYPQSLLSCAFSDVRNVCGPRTTGGACVHVHHYECVCVCAAVGIGSCVWYAPVLLLHCPPSFLVQCRSPLFAFSGEHRHSCEPRPSREVSMTSVL